MHKILVSLSVFMFFLTSSLSAFFDREYINNESNQLKTSSFESSDIDAVLNIDQEKVFLNPNCIVVDESGVYIRSNSKELIAIPALFSSAQGVYIMQAEVDSTVYPVIRCRNCNLPFNPSVFNQGKCPRCGTQN